MHLSIEMVRQSPIIIQTTQIRPTNITDLQLLVTRRAAGVAQGFKLAFFVLFGSFGDTDFMMLGYGEGDVGSFAQDGDFKEAGVDGVCEVGYLFQLSS